MTLFVAAQILTGCNQTSQTSTTMITRGYAFAPPAARDFCNKKPRLCSARGDLKVVKLTPELRAELRAVNNSVNSRIKERSDLASTAKADDWRLPTDEGD